MKYILKKIPLLAVILMISSCSIENIDAIEIQDNVTSNFTCIDANPEARFVNNGTIAFDFKIYDSNMTLLGDFQNVAPGSSTIWTSFTEGYVLFSLNQTTDSGISDQKIQTSMSNCTILDVTIGSNNKTLDNSPVGI